MSFLLNYSVVTFLITIHTKETLHLLRAGDIIWQCGIVSKEINKENNHVC